MTAFGIFLTPVFYYVLQWFGSGAATAAPEPVVAHAPSAAASTNGHVPLKAYEHVLLNGDGHPSTNGNGHDSGQSAGLPSAAPHGEKE